MFKSMLFGFVVGGVASIVTAMSAGWVVTEAKHDLIVQRTVTDTQASLCVSQALAKYKAGDRQVDLTGLSGGAREARLELARQFVAPLAGETSVDSSVVSACAHGLDDRLTAETEDDAPAET